MQSDLSLSYILRSSLSQVEEEAVRRACSLALAANVPLVVSAPSCPDVVAIIAEYQVLSLIYVSGSECIGRCGQLPLKGSASSDLASV